MKRIFVKDFYETFGIEQTQLNGTAIKAIIKSMESNGFAYTEKQMINIDEAIFEKIWHLYTKCLEFFDINYNRRSDFVSFCNCLINGYYKKQKIEFLALFCPGYTKAGYKDFLGQTTTSKIEKLSEIKNMLMTEKIDSEFTLYYSDVFLENCNDEINPNWKEELNYNRGLFHKEGEKYFPSSNVKNMTDVKVFQKDFAIEGYVDNEIISNLNGRTYYAFKKCNEKFYKSLKFTEEEMQTRNDKLITMYRVFSDYINKINNSVFLPMENMYERENIFSENGTCTMYLKLKKKV